MPTKPPREFRSVTVLQPGDYLSDVGPITAVTFAPDAVLVTVRLAMIYDATIRFEGTRDRSGFMHFVQVAVDVPALAQGATR